MGSHYGQKWSKLPSDRTGVKGEGSLCLRKRRGKPSHSANIEYTQEMSKLDGRSKWKGNRKMNKT